MSSPFRRSSTRCGASTLPANPGNALQVRVSKLRRALAAAGAPSELVVTRPPGYLLDCRSRPRGCAALHRPGRGRPRRRRADPAAAARLYREALAAWRGPALAEFADAAWAGPEAARLTELQLAAREELVDLELAAGRHTEVLGELEELTAAHPLRERLHGRLMLALYRAGRQADALAAYQRARDRARRRARPRPPARSCGDLQEAILQQRPDLAVPARPPAPERRDGARPSRCRPRLPARLTSFLGRDADLHRVGELLQTARLVTVTGPGGVGKTSLALEAARAAAERFGDGVGVRPAGRRHRRRLRCPRPCWPRWRSGTWPRRPPRTSCSVTCATARVLLVLDNCEHLADACALLAEHLLESCPGVRLLATSREPLAARGEVQYAIDPLPVPPAAAGAAELTGSAAAQLFLDRARGALPDFAVRDEADAAAVADICRHLDGMPLALELAAARVAALPVDELARRMGDRFALLTTGPRTAEARQRTLRATVDWSYQLLTDPERVLLRRLSVFRGSWTLEAMQAVAGGRAAGSVGRRGSARPAGRPVAGRRRPHPRRPRRRAALPPAGDHPAVRRRASGRVRRGRPDRPGARRLPHRPGRAGRDGAAWRRAGPLAAAAGRSSATTSTPRWPGAPRTRPRSPTPGCGWSAPLGWYWYFATQPDGGRRVAAMLAAAPGGSPAARARALQALAVAARPGACIVHPNPDCAAAAAQSRALFAELGDPFRTALSDTLAGRRGHRQRRAGRGLRRPAPRPTGSSPGTATRGARRWPTSSGWSCTPAPATWTRPPPSGTGRWRPSARWATSGVCRPSSSTSAWPCTAPAGWRRRWPCTRGRSPASATSGAANTVQYALAGAGHVSLLLGDADRAAALFAESHAVARQLGAEGNPRAAVGEGLLARERGDLAAARERLTFAQQVLAGLTEKPEWTAAALVGLGHLAEADGDLDSAEFFHRRAWQTAPGHAAALEGLACVAVARGGGADAARLLGAAAAWRRRRHRPADRLERADAERAEHGARAVLGDSGFDAAYRAGEAGPDAVLDDADHVPARR